MSLVLSFAVTRCTIRCHLLYHSLSPVVTLSLDVSLSCYKRSHKRVMLSHRVGKQPFDEENENKLANTYYASYIYLLIKYEVSNSNSKNVLGLQA